LIFESFPGEITESHSASYRGLGGFFMPQPLFALYRGGDWAPVELKLVFRAGENALTSAASLDQLLKQMEDKVRWCQALTFPMGSNTGIPKAAVACSLSALDWTSLTAQAQTLTLNVKQYIVSTLGYDPFPPIILVIFGSWWTLRGFAESVTVRWNSPWHPHSVKPYGAEVTIRIHPQRQGYPTWDVIRNLSARTPINTAANMVRMFGGVQ
jgi:hypothetical protein